MASLEAPVPKSAPKEAICYNNFSVFVSNFLESLCVHLIYDVHDVPNTIESIALNFWDLGLISATVLFMGFE